MCISANSTCCVPIAITSLAAISKDIGRSYLCTKQGSCSNYGVKAFHSLHPCNPNNPGRPRCYSGHMLHMSEELLPKPGRLASKKFGSCPGGLQRRRKTFRAFGLIEAASIAGQSVGQLPYFCGPWWCASRGSHRSRCSVGSLGASTRFYRFAD